ncbi:MAG: hypothetical protein N4A74_19120 [Carboxylicivirga sp.]|nr:hypothetical protein [Carboxylicivirga sp.]
MAKKVIASTLIEVIVAMVISSITIVFCLIIISNTILKDSLISNSYYFIRANHIMKEICQNDSLLEMDEITEEGKVSVVRSVRKYGQKPNLYIIEVKILDANGQIKATSKCLKRSR